MSNSVDENPQELVTDDEQPQKSSPTRRVAASNSDLELIERSQALLEVMKQVDRVCNTNLPVLLIGEPGTGKQLVACAIHQRSPRSDQPFIAANCYAVHTDTVDGETNTALQGPRPLWQRACGGTLFLDEVTEADSTFQEELLQALQAGEDVRVIVGSSRSVEQEVAAGRFRDDLFHALRGLSIVLPPHRGTQQRAAAPSEFANTEAVTEEWVPLSEIEGRYVARVLKHTRGNKQAAARVLSVDRKTLDRMIKRHHIVYPHARQRDKASVSS